MNREFCPYCGSRLSDKQVDGRVRDYCGECDEVVWENAKPFAGVLVVDEGKVLLIKRGVAPSVGKWSLPAGYMEQDETPETAVLRELEEETGLKVKEEDLTLFDTLLLQHPDGQYVLGIIFRAEAKDVAGNMSSGSDAQAAEYRDVESLHLKDISLESEKYLELFRKAVD